MLTIGEVHTGLLQHSSALSPMHATEILSLREGEPVLRSERPIGYAVSPEMLVGVDCQLPSHSGRKVRAVGTVSSRSIITGGRIVQGSSQAALIRAADHRRLPWSHYLLTPGQIEAIGKADWLDVRAGFTAGRAWPSTLDIAAISGRAMDAVQHSEHLDRRPPIRAPRTCLRWTITVAEGAGATATSEFTIHSESLRTLDLFVKGGEIDDAVALCEDLALHDWLLSTLAALHEQTLTSTRPVADRIARLRPAIEHLLHLWMPGARLADSVLPVWDDIERRPGFTRQWNASVNWIRDQIAVENMALLQVVALGHEAARTQPQTEPAQPLTKK